MSPGTRIGPYEITGAIVAGGGNLRAGVNWTEDLKRIIAQGGVR